jgi:hypothetical protein
MRQQHVTLLSADWRRDAVSCALVFTKFIFHPFDRVSLMLFNCDPLLQLLFCCISCCFSWSVAASPV